MIYLQLLLHPLGSEQYNYREFFIRIRELWICYCLMNDLPPIIIASHSVAEQYNYREFYYRIRELWICYCLLDDLPPIIIASPR